MVKQKKNIAFKPAYPYSKKHDTPATQQKEYEQTWLEFQTQRGEQIAESNLGDSSGTSIMYTVPVDKILFIFSIFLNIEVVAGIGTNRTAALRILTPASSIRLNLMQKRYSDTTARDIDLTLTFPSPIKVYPGEQIASFTEGSIHRANGFSGFLVPFVL